MDRETRTHLYILAFGVAAVTTAVAALAAWPVREYGSLLWLMPLLILLVAVAGRFSILLSPQADASLFTVPLYMAALLHPSQVVLVGALGVLISQVMLRRPLRAIAFNMGMAATAGGLAGVAFLSISGGTPLMLTQQHMLAAGMAGLVLHAHNILPVVGMLTIRKGARFWLFWAKSYTLEAMVEGILLSLGLISALLIVQAPWGLALMVLPGFAAYQVLKRTVEYAARKGMAAEELERLLRRELDAWEDLLAPEAGGSSMDAGMGVSASRTSLRGALR